MAKLLEPELPFKLPKGWYGADLHISKNQDCSVKTFVDKYLWRAQKKNIRFVSFTCLDAITENEYDSENVTFIPSQNFDVQGSYVNVYWVRPSETGKISHDVSELEKRTDNVSDFLAYASENNLPACYTPHLTNNGQYNDIITAGEVAKQFPILGLYMNGKDTSSKILQEMVLSASDKHGKGIIPQGYGRLGTTYLLLTKAESPTELFCDIKNSEVYIKYPNNDISKGTYCKKMGRAGLELLSTAI